MALRVFLDKVFEKKNRKNIGGTNRISRKMLKEEGASPEDLDTSILADEH